MTTQEQLKQQWDNSSGPVYRALDQCGCEIGNTMVRETAGGWLYLDDFEGYRRLEAEEVDSFLLVELKP